MVDAQIPTSIAEREGLVATPIVGHDALDGDAEAFVISHSRLEEGNSTLAVSSGLISEKPTREWLSMQTWTKSQPAPRLLFGPLRSPVMRWPTRSKRPIFLMSM